MLSCLLLCLPLLSSERQGLELPPGLSRSEWTVADGLPQNSVADVAQDAQGYYWICTFGGLARFDGRRFEVFDVGNRPDLAGNRFLEVHLGPDGDLWLLAMGVGLLRYDGERFERVEAAAEPAMLLVGEQDALWCAYPWGVGRLRGGELERVRECHPRSIAPSGDDDLWISTLEGELIHWRAEGERVLGAATGLPGKPLASMVEDGEGRLWVGNNLGVWRATDASNAAFEPLPDAPAAVHALALGEGVVWLACGDGLYRWDEADETATRVLDLSFDCLLLDRRGNLWAGGKGGVGLQCLRDGPLHDATAVTGLERDDTWCVTAGRAGAVLLVQTRELVEVRGAEVVRTPLQNNSNTALVDAAGDLWIGQSNGVLRLRDGERTAFGAESGLVGTVNVLYEDPAEGLLVGTGSGLFRRVGDRFEPLLDEELKHLRCVLRDARGVLWVGTQTGLVGVAVGGVRHLAARDGLSPGSVRALHEDEDGVLWVGTYGGGLSRVEDGRVTRFTRATGLADDFLASIIEDDHGRLWINANVGPFVVRREDLNRVARGEADSVACVTFARGEGAREANGGNQPCAWRSPEGWLWLPTTEGVTVALPDELPLDEAPPEVRVETLALSDRRALDVRYTALGFSSPARVQFRHRLVGQEDDWVGGDASGAVRYSYVPPGAYEFRVQARNGFGPWSPEAVETFEVAPRFHETTGFYLGSLLVIALVVGGFAEQRQRRSRRLAETLSRAVEERGEAQRSLSRSRSELSRLSRELLKQQEQERGWVSRELHDDVTQRLAALGLKAELVEGRLESDGERAHEGLRELILDARQLAGDVQQLSRRLHPVGLLTLGLAEAMRQECVAFERRNGLRVELDEDLVSDEVPEALAIAAFRIFQESLHNVEKHAGAADVEVAMRLEGGEFELSIRDSGCGFEAGEGATAGLGLITMRERAAAVGGVLTIESRAGEGSRVTLRVPVRGARA